MSEAVPVPLDEGDRMPLPRDPPAPPGYVDPLEGHDVLQDVATLVSDAGPDGDTSRPRVVAEERDLP